MNVIEALENRIKKLQDWEGEAGEAKDYPACIQLYGAIIYFKQFVRELKADAIRNGNS